LFLWKAFKTIKSGRRFENADVADFQEENAKFSDEILKGLSSSTAPSIYNSKPSHIKKCFISQSRKCM